MSDSPGSAYKLIAPNRCLASKRECISRTKPRPRRAKRSLGCVAVRRLPFRSFLIVFPCPVRDIRTHHHSPRATWAHSALDTQYQTKRGSTIAWTSYETSTRVLLTAYSLLPLRAKPNRFAVKALRRLRINMIRFPTSGVGLLSTSHLQSLSYMLSSLWLITCHS